MRYRFGFSPARGSSVAAAFTPAALFASAQQGVWFDLSDITSMFQDTAGTAAAVGSPVGLILDKRLGTYGSEIVSNGTFATNTTGWSPSACTISVVNGELEAVSTAGGAAVVTQTLTGLTVGKVYRLTGSLRTGPANAVSLTARIVLSAPAIQKIATAENTTQTIDVAFVATATSTDLSLQIASGGAFGATGDKAYFDNLSVKEVIGNHASQTTTASKPILRQTSGRYYLEFDGVDDFLTASVDLSASDAIAVSVAQKKMADPAGAYLLDCSFANGTFSLWAPRATTGAYNFTNKGTTQGEISGSNHLAPDTSVVTGQGKISTDLTSIRYNGVSEGSVATDLGTGNYGSVTLYIGQRFAATNRYNGQIYGIVIRGGGVSGSELASLETHLGSKCGVTI